MRDLTLPTGTVPGMRLSDVQVLDLVGSGAVASVYRVAQEGNLYALKRWRAEPELEVMLNIAEVCRLQTELSDHPNIVRLVSFEATPGQPPWQITELYDESLEARLTRDGSVPRHEAVGLIDDFLSGLAAIHGRARLHGNIKPANVLLSGGRAAIGDLGLPPHLVAPTAARLADAAEFIAPEVGQGVTPGRRADVYSAAVTIRRMLATDMPPAIRAVLDRATAERPEDRPPHAMELLDQLRAAFAEFAGPAADARRVVPVAVITGQFPVPPEPVPVPPPAQLGDVPITELVVVKKDMFPGRGQSLGLHRVTLNGRPLIFKVYKRDMRLDGDVLRNLVQWRLGMTDDARAHLDKHAAFPTHVVTHDGAVVGVCMPEADACYTWQPPRGGSTRARALDYLSLSRTRSEKLGHSFYEAPHKLALLGDVLQFLLWLHDHGVIIGDLNAQNVLITGAPDDPAALRAASRFILLDCDSLWIGGRGAMDPHEPPGLRCDFGPEDGFDQRTDLFKFAMLAVRCLQENNADPPPDEHYLRSVMPTDQMTHLVNLLDPGIPPSIERLRGTARAWSQRMRDGRMFQSTDGAVRAPWTGPTPPPAGTGASVRALHPSHPVPSGPFPTSFAPDSGPVETGRSWQSRLGSLVGRGGRPSV